MTHIIVKYSDLYRELTKSRIQQLVNDVQCLLNMIKQAQNKNTFKELPLQTLKMATEKVISIAKALGYSPSCQQARAITDLPYVLCGFIPRIKPHGDITYILYTLRNTPLKIVQSIYPSFNPNDSFIQRLGIETYQPYGPPPIDEVYPWTTFVSLKDYPRYFYLERLSLQHPQFRAYITNSFPQDTITCDDLESNYYAVKVELYVDLDSIMKNVATLGTAILLLSIASGRVLMSADLRGCPISRVLTEGIVMDYDTSYDSLYESSDGILSKNCRSSRYKLLLEDLAQNAEKIIKGDVDIFFSRGETGTVYLMTTR